MFNKKGNLFTDNSIFVLSSIVGIGLLVMLVINPVLHGFLAPALLAQTSGATTTLLTEKYNFILTMTDLMPYILFFVAIVYLIVLIFRKERVEYYG